MYSQSDVLVLPSISTNEAFGLVTLEAAVAGCVGSGFRPAGG